VETMREYMAAVNRNGLDSFSAEEPQKGEITHLLQSIALANKKIYARSIKDESCRGMGTTISALYIFDGFMITANVGDSPIYLIRDGEVEDLYTPHTLLHERKTTLKSLEGRYPPAKLAHILTRAVGIRQSVRVDRAAMTIRAKDIIVLCSDGLSGKVSREEIGALVAANSSEAACKKLTGLALERGGQDNITVVVVKVLSKSGKPEKGVFHRFVTFPIWLGSLLKRRRSEKL